MQSDRGGGGSSPLFRYINHAVKLLQTGEISGILERNLIPPLRDNIISHDTSEINGNYLSDLVKVFYSRLYIIKPDHPYIILYPAGNKIV